MLKYMMADIAQGVPTVGCFRGVDITRWDVVCTTIPNCVIATRGIGPLLKDSRWEVGVPSMSC